MHPKHSRVPTATWMLIMLAELQELQDGDLEEDLLNIPNAPSNSLPQPSNKAKSTRNQDEDELAQLAAWSS